MSGDEVAELRERPASVADLRLLVRVHLGEGGPGRSVEEDGVVAEAVRAPGLGGDPSGHAPAEDLDEAAGIGEGQRALEAGAPLFGGDVRGGLEEDPSSLAIVEARASETGRLHAGGPARRTDP